jgi:hypothetical protein
MNTDRDNSFDAMIETFKIIAIIVTMLGWLLVGLVGAVVAAFLGTGIEWIWLIPVGALACGAINCVVMSSHKG